MPEDKEQENNLDKLQQDLDAVTNNWKRALADFENYKKQKERENRELIEFAREVTVAKLLPTLDTLGQALRHVPEIAGQRISESADQQNSESTDGLISGLADTPFAKAFNNWKLGINGIVMQLDKVLAELGVKKIEALGKKFDPHFHEAVREVESEKDDGIIIDELQSGFILNDKVIRPSQVIISKRQVASSM